MSNRGECAICGADNALHHFDTDQCPVGGVEETRIGVRQEWAETKFTSPDNHAPTLKLQLQAREELVKELAEGLEYALERIRDFDPKGDDLIYALISKASGETQKEEI